MCSFGVEKMELDRQLFVSTQYKNKIIGFNWLIIMFKNMIT